MCFYTEISSEYMLDYGKYTQDGRVSEVIHTLLRIEWCSSELLHSNRTSSHLSNQLQRNDDREQFMRKSSSDIRFFLETYSNR